MCFLQIGSCRLGVLNTYDQACPATDHVTLRKDSTETVSINVYLNAEHAVPVAWAHYVM